MKELKTEDRKAAFEFEVADGVSVGEMYDDEGIQLQRWKHTKGSAGLVITDL